MKYIMIKNLYLLRTKHKTRIGLYNKTLKKFNCLKTNDVFDACENDVFKFHKTSKNANKNIVYQFCNVENKKHKILFNTLDKTEEAIILLLKANIARLEDKFEIPNNQNQLER